MGLLARVTRHCAYCGADATAGTAAEPRCGDCARITAAARQATAWEPVVYYSPATLRALRGQLRAKETVR